MIKINLDVNKNRIEKSKRVKYDSPSKSQMIKERERKKFNMKVRLLFL